MTEQQIPDIYEHEAPEADAAEQSLPTDRPDPESDEARDVRADPEVLEVPWDVDPADAAEQAVPVPVDEDEYR